MPVVVRHGYAAGLVLDHPELHVLKGDGALRAWDRGSSLTTIHKQDTITAKMIVMNFHELI